MAIPRNAVNEIITNVVLLFLSVVAVSLRYASRIKTKSPLRWDDWTILFSLICSVGLCASAVWATTYGIRGVPLPSLTLERWVQFEKLLFADILICHFVYGLIKLSVILFYKRIFTLNRTFNICANILMGTTIVFIILFFFLVLFSSPNVSGFWTRGAHVVVDLGKLITSVAVIDIFLDLCILVLPIPILVKLHLPRSKKMSIVAIFLSGGFCLVSSAVRLYYAHTVLNHKGRIPTEYIDNNDLWAHIEAFASIITACLPTLGPIITNSRSLQSLVRSVSSLFSIGSRSSDKLNPKPDSPADGSCPKPSGRGEKRAWYEVPTEGSEFITTTRETGEDFERGIMVQQILSVQ